MIKIIRKRHFFKQFQNLILGTLWIIVGISHLLLSENEDFVLLSVLYLLLGLFYFFLHFYQTDRNQEFIAWDEEQVILSKWQLKPATYSLAEINQITLTKSYFIINSTPETPGETMELSGYSENDINLLKSRFSSEEVASA